MVHVDSRTNDTNHSIDAALDIALIPTFSLKVRVKFNVV